MNSPTPPPFPADSTTENTRRGGPGITHANVITAALEQEILAGDLRPGARLDEEGIGKRFGVSRTPVREAFKHLASAGLLEIKPHTGAFVASLTVEIVVEMFEMMAVLESACAALASRRHNAEDRLILVAAHQACAKATKRKDPKHFYEANKQFHEAVYKASHNGYLETQTINLRNRLEAYRRAATFHSGLMSVTITEHERILQAILDMDEATAATMMRGHLDTLRDDAVSITKALNLLAEPR
jgi:DNA-binding GntR family transcriptional regulator